VSSSDRLRIAVFIDFDNIEIGVKNTLNSSFDAGLVLEALKERGEVVSKMAYSDWQRSGGYSRQLGQHAIRMVQRNMTPGGDKNGADINLALDALEMAFTHSHINAFVIVGGDSDFISLVEKLKQYDKKVFVVGGRQFTSQIMQKNCHEFIAYENLVRGQRRQGGGGGGERQDRGDRMPIDQAVPLVTRAMSVLSERESAPPLGLLKTTLLQLDSTFDERSYGAGTFRDFAQKLEKAGVLKVMQGRGGWVVAPSDSAPAAAPASPVAPSAPTADDATPVPVAAPPAPPSAHPNAPTPAPPVIGTPLEGVRAFAKVLSASEIRKWPLYLRNVKQILRAAQPPFDERAYGYANLTDLLRAAGKDGLVRVDRDRQGVIRVFQGSLPVAVVETAPADPADMAAEAPVVEAAPAETVVEPTAEAAADAPVESGAKSKRRGGGRKPAARGGGRKKKA
jgi:uncharacterized LabA/DUF88 family protein